MSSPASERGYNVPLPAIHWINDDILLDIFHCYQLDEKNGWNDRLGWCKLSQVCQRWRHLIYECSSHLGMHIKCTNGSPNVDMLDHLTPLPLYLGYFEGGRTTLTEEDELGLVHALRLHERVYCISLELPPSILHKVFVLLDGNFPMLEYLSVRLSAGSKKGLLLTLPKSFLASKLRYLTLPHISPLRRLQVLTSTVALVSLTLREIQTSSYFWPRLLIACLSSLPLLERLFIIFSIPIPHPSAERKLLGEQGAPVTLPSLKILWFKGVGAYLESLVAQIRVPLLARLDITLYNQISIALPHLTHLINITVAFRLPSAEVHFDSNEVRISTDDRAYHSPQLLPSPCSPPPFQLIVLCEPLDWQVDCSTQICLALIPALSCVERLGLYQPNGRMGRSTAQRGMIFSGHLSG